MKSNSLRILGTAIFLLAALLGLALATAAVWEDFEGMSYFYSGAGYASFNGLNCPVLLSRGESARVSATFDNPEDRENKPYYQMQISSFTEQREFKEQITVPPHGTKTVDWTVNVGEWMADPGDIGLSRLIMVDLQVSPVGNYPTRESTCGMLVLDANGLTGGQLLGWLLGLSLAGMVVGLALREGRAEPIPGRPATLRNGLRAVGIATSLALLTGLLGWWLIGILFIVIALLLGFILLRFAF